MDSRLQNIFCKVCDKKLFLWDAVNKYYTCTGKIYRADVFWADENAYKEHRTRETLKNKNENK